MGCLSRDTQRKTSDEPEALGHLECPNAPIARRHRRRENFDEDFFAFRSGLFDFCELEHL